MKIITNINDKKISADLIALKDNNKAKALTDKLNSIDEKLNDLIPVVGWSNPNPNSSFSKSEITMSVSFNDYSYYEIIYKGYRTNNGVASTGKVPTNFGAFMLYFEYSANMAIRNTSVPNGNKLAFGDASTSNDFLTPQQILFYK